MKDKNYLQIDNLPEIVKAEIDCKQLIQNMKILRSRLDPKTRFLAVLKGDAYGHGMIPMGHLLQQNNCDALGVVRLNEAVSLRKSGVTLPILIMSPLMPEQAPWVVEYDITVMVDNDNLINALQDACISQNKNVKVHIKVNTGLNRYGILPQLVPSFIRNLKANYNRIIIEGIYSHFRDAEYNSSFTEMQFNMFKDLLDRLDLEELRPPLAHISASGGILMYPRYQLDMVRCGLSLYGISPKDNYQLPNGMNAVMTLKGRILKLISIKEGSSAGYGDRFIASRDSRLAVIGIGYGDGISRNWKEVLIGGCKVPAVNFSMDCLMADITDLSCNVKELDEAVFVGRQNDVSITWEDACAAIHTNVDEQLQRITKRVPKEYIKSQYDE